MFPFPKARIVLLSAALGASAASAALAATITVTGAGDTAAVDGVVTLREAILSINAGTSVNADVLPVGAYGTNDRIDFNIPGGGVHTILSGSTSLTALPDLTKAMTIDGYTQPGSSPNSLAIGDNAVLRIQLGSLHILFGQTTVRGLVISAGVLMDFGVGHNTIAGNFIGVDPTGTISAGGSFGVFLYAPQNVSPTDNRIGGTDPADRNVISASVMAGIHIQTDADRQVIQGNYIGTNAAGTQAIPNLNGIEVYGNGLDHLIGGTAPGAGNLISGNSGVSIYIDGFLTTIQGNLIGTDATGSAPLGNGQPMAVDRACTVGGTVPGAGNVIAYNHGNGVIVRATDNRINGNSIFSNTGLGIDFGSQGLIANDACDGDFGPNFLQNFPVLTSAAVLGGSGTLEGTLNSTGNKTFRIEFFSNVSCDPSGYGQGQTYLGFIDVTTDPTCNAIFGPVSFPVPAGQAVFTATATDPNGNTSEFSACLPAGAKLTPTPTATPTRTATPTPTPTPTTTATPQSVRPLRPNARVVSPRPAPAPTSTPMPSFAGRPGAFVLPPRPSPTPTPTPTRTPGPSATS